MVRAQSRRQCRHQHALAHAKPAGKNRHHKPGHGGQSHAGDHHRCQAECGHRVGSRRIERPDHRELAQAEQDPAARGPEKTLAQEPRRDARQMHQDPRREWEA